MTRSPFVLVEQNNPSQLNQFFTSQAKLKSVWLLLRSNMDYSFTLQWLPEIIIRYQRNLYCPFRLIFYDIIMRWLDLFKEELFAFVKKPQFLSHSTIHYFLSLYSVQQCLLDLTLTVTECYEINLELITSFHFVTGLLGLQLQSVT